MAEDPAFAFGNHSALFDRNNSTRIAMVDKQKRPVAATPESVAQTLDGWAAMRRLVSIISLLNREIARNFIHPVGIAARGRCFVLSAYQHLVPSSLSSQFRGQSEKQSRNGPITREELYHKSAGRNPRRSIA